MSTDECSFPPPHVGYVYSAHSSRCFTFYSWAELKIRLNVVEEDQYELVGGAEAHNDALKTRHPKDSSKMCSSLSNLSWLLCKGRQHSQPCTSFNGQNKSLFMIGKCEVSKRVLKNYFYYCIQEHFSSPL
jgi:hypothetical protein